MADDQKPKAYDKFVESVIKDAAAVSAASKAALQGVESVMISGSAFIGPNTVQETKAYFDSLNAGHTGDTVKHLGGVSVAAAQEIAEDIAKAYVDTAKHLVGVNVAAAQEIAGDVAAAYKNVTNPDMRPPETPGAKPVGKNLHHGGHGPQ